MEKGVVFAINYALNKGFQIHPNALKILERVDVNELERVIKEIVQEKSKQKLFLINQDDLEVFLGLKDDEKLESEYRVLSDPSSKITSADRVERNITKLIIDDPTGSIETIVFDKDLQKTAAALLTDQFVMERISFGKNGGFIVKDIIIPDIPEHIPNRSKTETCAAFLSDLHIGSMYFMEKELNDFISWLS